MTQQLGLIFDSTLPERVPSAPSASSGSSSGTEKPKRAKKAQADIRTDAAPAIWPPAPLSDGQMIAVIGAVMLRDGGYSMEDPAAKTWLATHFRLSDYAHAIPRGATVTPDVWAAAYRHMQETVGNRRPAGGVKPAPEPTPQALERYEQKQAAMVAEQAFMKEALQRLERLGEFTGDYSTAQPAKRALEAVIKRYADDIREGAE